MYGGYIANGGIMGKWLGAEINPPASGVAAAIGPPDSVASNQVSSPKSAKNGGSALEIIASGVGKGPPRSETVSEFDGDDAG